MKDITLIGKILKPHGVKGWLRTIVNTPFEEDLAKATVVFIKKGSHPVPYFVKAFDAEKLHILLEDIDSKEAAQTLSKLELYLRHSDIIAIETRTKQEVESYLSLIGFNIQVAGDVLGAIEEIIEYPQQEMAFIQYNGKEVMIPLNAAYIQAIDSQARLIKMDLPDGFLELF